MLKRFLWFADALAMTISIFVARLGTPAVQGCFGPEGALRFAWLGWLALPAIHDPNVELHGQSAVTALIALPVTILFLQAGRGYVEVLHQSTGRMLWRCFAGPTVGLGAVTLVVFGLHLAEWSRALGFTFWALSIGGLLSWRIVVRRVILWRRKQGLYCKTVAVIGRRVDAEALLEKLTAQISDCDYRLLGYYEVQSGTSVRPSRFQRLGNTRDFASSLIHTPVSLALIVESDGGAGWLPDVLRMCDYFRLPAQVVSSAVMQVEDVLTDLHPRHLSDQLPFAAVVFEPSELNSDGAVFKRMFDLVVSAALLIALMPLFLLVAIAIKLTTPHLPVLYRYKQIGLQGAEFTAFKFTTMVRDAEKLKASLLSFNEMQGPVFKIRNDPRITRLGRFLRVSSINELPQLFNVLKGDLSLVGPRAALPSELAGYKLWHKRKLTVKPGLTCLWQVSGRNRISSFDDWVRLDLQYIDNRSLWLDLKILARTAGVVLKGSGS